MIAIVNKEKRRFIKEIALAGGVLSLFFVDKLMKNQGFYHSPDKIFKIQKKSINEGMTFYENILINKVNNNFKVFSSICPHLGCKINHVKDGFIVCPCHGSKYDTNGIVISGPSSENLKKLNFEQNELELIIFL